MKKIYLIQLIIQCIVGIGALFGGFLAITDPYGTSIGGASEMLKRGPFTSFLIPGLFLFIVIGLGHLTAFVFIKRRMKFHPYISGAAGGILVAWIVIQCYVMQAVNPLHVTFFLVGGIEGLISVYMLIKLKLFPFSYINGKGEKNIDN